MINYEIRKISTKSAKEYIHKNHYSHSSHNIPSPCYGLFDGEQLIGAMMFAVPCSEAIRACVFGKEYKDHVIELHRLHIMDVTPRNTESWFISRCLKQLKLDLPKIWAVISYSDKTEGHEGTIYKATNAYRIGTTRQTTTFYRDLEGKLRHPRQCGINIDKDMALEMGWTLERRYAKNRYLWLLPDDKRHKKHLLDICRFDIRSQKFD